MIFVTADALDGLYWSRSNAGFLFFGTVLRQLALRQQGSSGQTVEGTPTELSRLSGSVDGIILDSAPAYITPDIAARCAHAQHIKMLLASGWSGSHFAGVTHAAADLTLLVAQQRFSFSAVADACRHSESSAPHQRCSCASGDSAVSSAASDSQKATGSAPMPTLLLSMLSDLARCIS